MPFETPDLVASSGTVPERVTTDRFVVRPLTVDDAAMDYEAVTSSKDRLAGTFGPDDDWPEGLIRKQNRIDLAWHQKEHQRRDAFTYGVFDPEERSELGCVYVQPTRAPGYDAAVYFWTSTAAAERDLADPIERRVRRWIAEDWPFDEVAYPGRDVAWTGWGPATTT